MSWAEPSGCWMQTLSVQDSEEFRLHPVQSALVIMSECEVKGSDQSFLLLCSSGHFSVTVCFQHFIVIISLIYIFILIISLHSILKVPEVISRIRQVSKSVLKGDAKPKQEADEAFYNSQKFEVLYCGKVEPPPTHTHTQISYFHTTRHRCWL